MAIRRKSGVRTVLQRRLPSPAKQALLKANLSRFQDLVASTAAKAPPAATQAAPEPPPRRAPVGEILPPDAGGAKMFSPGTRLAEASRHVRDSVRDARTIIRESERLFLHEHRVSADPLAEAKQVSEQAASGTGQVQQGVTDTVASALSGQRKSPEGAAPLHRTESTGHAELAS